MKLNDLIKKLPTISGPALSYVVFPTRRWATGGGGCLPFSYSPWDLQLQREAEEASGTIVQDEGPELCLPADCRSTAEAWRLTLLPSGPL